MTSRKLLIVLAASTAGLAGCASDPYLYDGYADSDSYYYDRPGYYSYGSPSYYGYYPRYYRGPSLSFGLGYNRYYWR